MSQLTVKELKTLLNDFDEDMKVTVEGCDCVGKANSVSLSNEWVLPDPEPQDCVLIGRET